MDFRLFQPSGLTSKLISLLAGYLFAFAAQADDSSKLDMIGGRIDNGKYRCYAEPCFSIVRNTKLTKANKKAVHFDLDDWQYDTVSSEGCRITRTKVLTKASQIKPHIKQQGACKVVTSGKWLDVYSGNNIDSPNAVSIDHRISLTEAYRYGGAFWSNQTKVAFANDPDNLMTVSASKKKERASQPASQWLPDKDRYWCDYIVHRELIVQRYNLIFSYEEEEFNKKIKMSHCKY